MNDFICNWNTLSYGKAMFEEWAELDGGVLADARNANASFPPECAGCPAVTRSYVTWANLNDVLGSAIVSFDHSKSQIYTMRSSNFKRK